MQEFELVDSAVNYRIVNSILSKKAKDGNPESKQCGSNAFQLCVPQWELIKCFFTNSAPKNFEGENIHFCWHGQQQEEACVERLFTNPTLKWFFPNSTLWNGENRHPSGRVYTKSSFLFFEAARTYCISYGAHTFDMRNFPEREKTLAQGVRTKGWKFFFGGISTWQRAQTLMSHYSYPVLIKYSWSRPTFFLLFSAMTAIEFMAALPASLKSFVARFSPEKLFFVSPTSLVQPHCCLPLDYFWSLFTLHS